MAVYYVNSVGGSNTSPYDTWAKGATALGTITALPVAATDTIYIASDHNETPGTAAKTFTFPSTPGCQLICADRTSGEPPTTLATGAIVSIGAGNAAMAINGFVYIYGITFKSATNANSSSTLDIGVATTPHNLTFESCLLELQNTSTTVRINLGPTGSGNNDDVVMSLVNTAIKFAATAQNINLRNARVLATGLSIDGASSAPTTLITPASASSGVFECSASDLTGKTWTNLMSWGASQGPARLWFTQCKFPSGWAPTTGTPPGAGGPELLITDCNSGNIHTYYAYINAIGSAVSDTSNYVTAGLAAQSWKITTSGAKYGNPFMTPWLNLYTSDTSTAITPYLELLRNNGTATAYYDDEVWAEFEIKNNASATNSTRKSDRLAPLGTRAVQTAGMGTGSWTIGSSSSPASFKAVSPSSSTPAVVGHIRARLCVGIDISGTLYLDPQIRT